MTPGLRAHIGELLELADDVPGSEFIDDLSDVPKVVLDGREVVNVTGTYDLWRKSLPVKFSVDREAAVHWLRTGERPRRRRRRA